MAPRVFPKGYKPDKGARKKAFVEGRIIVEKAIEEEQMFVEHLIFCILVLDRFVREKVFITSILSSDMLRLYRPNFFG